MWAQGFSWTTGYDTMMKNPDGTMYHAVGKPGPFLFIHWKIPYTQRVFELYIGWRPTPGYSPLQDDHWHTRMLARIGIGFTNFGMAFRPFRKNP